MQLRSISIAAVLLSIYFVVQFLDISQSILIPFIFAVLICNLLSTIANFFQQAPHIGQYIPRWIAMLSTLSAEKLWVCRSRSTTQ